MRVEHLQQRLERGSLAVRETRYRRSGKYVSISLDDDTVLVLRLFWSCDWPLAALTGMAQDGRIGWVVSARTNSGRPIVLHAWLATLNESSSTPE